MTGLLSPAVAGVDGHAIGSVIANSWKRFCWQRAPVDDCYRCSLPESTPIDPPCDDSKIRVEGYLLQATAKYLFPIDDYGRSDGDY